MGVCEREEEQRNSVCMYVKEREIETARERERERGERETLP